MDDEVIRKRLCVEGEGGSDDRRVMSLLKTFVRWAGDSTLSVEERDATYQKMLFTLSRQQLMQLDVPKYPASQVSASFLSPRHSW